MLIDVLTVLAWAPPPADGAAGDEGGFGAIMPFVMFGLIFAIFYFMVMRPQQKRLKEHQALVSAVKRGDRVVMQGGLHGIVRDVKDTTIDVEVAPKVVATYEKSAVQSVSSDE